MNTPNNKKSNSSYEKIQHFTSNNVCDVGVIKKFVTEKKYRKNTTPEMKKK